LLSWSLLEEYREENRSALEKARRALELSQQVDSPLYESASRFRLGQAFLSAGQVDEARAQFLGALDLQRKLGMENRALESLAGLARASLASADLAAASGFVEEILPHLKTKNLLGTEEPIRAYLTAFEVLRANADPRAPAILETGYQFLQEQAATIHDEMTRRSFLEQVPANRRLIHWWQERG
jgi:hypothetical protein